MAHPPIHVIHERRGLRRNRRPAALVAGLTVTLASALTLSSCATLASNSAVDAGQLRVVATTTQLADFVSEVGDGDIELHGLMAPGASAHHFDPSPADLLALAEADVLVTNGLGLEPFLDSAIEASGFRGEIVTASDGIDLEEAAHISEDMGGDAHDGELAEHADHGDEHAAEDSHDGHDHGPVNPHIWTSPRQAQGMVTEVARGLAAADEAHASDYEQRAESYIERLQALDAWAAAQFDRVPEADRVLVTGHDSLSYYLHDYDIAFAGSILPSFEDNAEPSATEIDALVARIKQLGVPAIFVESSMSPKLARTIAREAGVQVIDAESLYADALGPAGSGADTYFDATAHNTRVILEAWGVDPDPLPAMNPAASAADTAAASAAKEPTA
ncbi:metal ABC transporter solute-binding protein, Zn/Mn family [Leucobacter salsicius]|uniref:metal ABC transporter solute-binding protein, Zn/Mn family n=1 Tax=Leucobacter salsicius TaxID=664638 RepID=UPI00034957FB|nr:zinc ABC transporter substrate-binding protein [Leucobacter salsicius]